MSKFKQLVDACIQDSEITSVIDGASKSNQLTTEQKVSIEARAHVLAQKLNMKVPTQAYMHKALDQVLNYNRQTR